MGKWTKQISWKLLTCISQYQNSVTVFHLIKCVRDSLTFARTYETAHFTLIATKYWWSLALIKKKKIIVFALATEEEDEEKEEIVINGEWKLENKTVMKLWSDLGGKEGGRGVRVGGKEEKENKK